MNETSVHELLRSTVEGAPPARFDLDAAMRAGRRRRRTRQTSALLSTAAVVAVVAALSWGHLGTGTNDPVPSASSVGPAPSPAFALPRGVVATGPQAYAVQIAAASGRDAATAPVVDVWIDFQSPLVRPLVLARGADLDIAGSAQVFYRPVSFLDQTFDGDKSATHNPESSLRAIAAWGCAIDAGKAQAYLETVFAHQPEREGDGFTDVELVRFAQQSGIGGDAIVTFTDCMTAGTYRGWATAASRQLEPSGIAGVPSVLINGTLVDAETTIDPPKLAQAIRAAQ